MTTKTDAQKSPTCEDAVLKDYQRKHNVSRDKSISRKMKHFDNGF